jgi:uncharacterized protein (UPF0335 family)
LIPLPASRVSANIKTRQEASVMQREHIKILVERLTRIENEIKLLQTDRKELLDEYKEKINLKAFRAAWQIMKKRKDLDISELDDLLKVMEDVR